MFTKPTREEMIRMVEETKKQVTSAPVSPEELAEYPAVMKELSIPTSEGASACFLSSPMEAEGEVLPLVINFHGGGFIRERTACDELFCRKLTVRLHCRVLDVDYRLAPRYPFPHGLNESVDVVIWAREHAEELGVNPSQIILCGHSAGGNYVVGVTMKLKEMGKKLPLGVISDYPPMDLATDPGKKEQRGKSIPAERARLYNLYYCEEEDQKNPYASPIFWTEEQLKGFPRTLIMTAEEDSLCVEAEEFALKLGRAGNEVTLKRFEGAGHGFTIYKKAGHEEAENLIELFIRMLLG